MAEKILKTRAQFTSTLKKELLEAMQQYSRQTDIPLSKLFDRAVEQFLSSKKEPSNE